MLRSSPGILHRVFNKVDTGTTAFSIAKSDPVRPLEVSNCRLILKQGHKALYLGEQAPEYNVTTLNNGFTVLTES